MSAAAFDFHGASLVADASGALYWPAKETLAVADLHLEKGSAFAANGTLLPPYDSRETLRRLRIVLRRHRPRRVICLGDSFHDTAAADRLAVEDAATLRRLTKAHEWIWITGNHDPEPMTGIGGVFLDSLALGPVTFRHQASPESLAGEISGHLHPVAVVSARGRGLRRRCFVGDGRRLVMPAFGAYAGGLNVRHRAFAMFESRFTAHLLGRDRVHAFSAAHCLPD